LHWLSIYKTADKNSPGFFVLFTGSVTPSGIYGTLLLSLMLPNNSEKKALFAGIGIYSHGIAGFTDQLTAYRTVQP